MTKLTRKEKLAKIEEAFDPPRWTWFGTPGNTVFTSPISITTTTSTVGSYSLPVNSNSYTFTPQQNNNKKVKTKQTWNQQRAIKNSNSQTSRKLKRSQGR